MQRKMRNAELMARAAASLDEDAAIRAQVADVLDRVRRDPRADATVRALLQVADLLDGHVGEAYDRNDAMRRAIASDEAGRAGDRSVLLLCDTAYEAGIAEGERRATVRVVPSPRRKDPGRHGKNRPLLNFVKGGLAAFTGAAAVLSKLHHPHAAVAAAKSAPLAAKTLAAVVALAVPTAAVVGTGAAIYNAQGGTAAGQPQAAASSPALQPSDQAQLIISSLTQPGGAVKNGKPDVTRSGILPPPAPGYPSGTVPQSTPASAPVPAVPAAAPAGPVAGTLQVNGSSGPSSITITDPTQRTPVTVAAAGGRAGWSGSCDDPGVRLSQSNDLLDAGQSDTVYITITKDAQPLGGTTVCSFTAGDQDVPLSVTWNPPATPSPAATDTGSGGA